MCTVIYRLFLSFDTYELCEKEFGSLQAPLAALPPFLLIHCFLISFDEKRPKIFMRGNIVLEQLLVRYDLL